MRIVLFAVQRLALMVVSLFALLSLTFLLTALIPSNPARTVAGPIATDEQVAVIAHQLGLDRPLGVRYLDYLQALAHGDLGTSYFSKTTVASQIATYLPSTLELMVLGLIIAIVVGLLLGALSAVYHRRAADRVSLVVVGIIESMPSFVLGILLVYIFFTQLAVLPGPEGQLSIAASPPTKATGFTIIDAMLTGQPDLISDAVSHAVLPALTLGLVLSPVFARVGRVALREALESDYVKFARACGLPGHMVFGYAMRLARTPLLTYGALVFGLGIGGTAIIETIFNWNGLSQWAVAAMLKSDYPEVQGFILVAGSFTLIVYLLLDLIVTVLDPRLRARRTRSRRRTPAAITGANAQVRDQGAVDRTATRDEATSAAR
jgi:peptide/nickel transport system permease protein